MNRNLEYALKYADLGWSSFAVNKEKKPIVRKSWVTECTTRNEPSGLWFGQEWKLWIFVLCVLSIS